MESVIKIYFDHEPPYEVISMITEMESFFSNPAAFCTYFTYKPSSPYPKEFGLNYSKLIQDTNHDIELSRIFCSLRSDPMNFMPSLNVSIHRILLKNIEKSALIPIRVYILKYDVFTPLNSIRSALINRFVAISGNIVKVFSKKPFVTGMEFLCCKCKGQIFTEFPEGKFIYPKICPNPDCKNFKSFQPLRETAKCVDYQRVKIQESSNDEQSGVPLTLDCEARNFDISEISVGDPVTVMGVVKAESSDMHKNKNTGLYGLYLDISSISCIKESSTQDDEFSQEDILSFQELAKTSNIFPLLVKTFCTLIYGLEKVKAGLILGLLGGSEEQGRSTSHILIVGDPGLGKTQLLRTTVNFSLRGIYVSATTRAGLTVNITREGGQNLMRAGALIMADDGVCAIDEFDKMGKDQLAMLEVMEQQTITVAKSGVYCSLKARATVIAAANSAGGHYNPSKSLVENLKINAALLSRFDLIFLLLDNHDAEVSKHVISMHNGRKRTYEQAFKPEQPSYTVKRSFTQSTVFSQTKNSAKFDTPFDDESYTSFLQRVINDITIELSVETMKKYIEYARKFCKPKLSDEAVEIINSYYTSMRKDTQLGCLSITTRQLESLKRLTEARAKAELRECATENDAIEVIKLYQETVFDLKSKDFIAPKMSKQGSKSGNIGELSIAKQQAAFIEKLQEIALAKNSDVITFQELHEISKDLGLRVGDFGMFIEKLNMANFILKKSPGVYKICVKFYS
ncbi:hypothetical protein SteCoe_14996 [Stentor coeruleus]|uniref:DNA helicase n=1 Tax=Stentor coeruleus TaxID=5963 RepID=A0A1R2C4J9_9CILI|nr:hypothetical protein SteCoe_14996 [Stentor coeruleus]